MKKLVLLTIGSAFAISWLNMPVHAQGGDYEKYGMQTPRNYCEPSWSAAMTNKCPKKNGPTAARASARKKR